MRRSQQLTPSNSLAVVTLATRLMERYFRHLESAAVCTAAEDVLWLASRVKGAAGLEHRFSSAVPSAPDAVVPERNRLKMVFQLEAVKKAVRGGNAFWQALAERAERGIQKLEALRPPAFSWHQPQANVPGMLEGVGGDSFSAPLPNRSDFFQWRSARLADRSVAHPEVELFVPVANALIEHGKRGEICAHGA